MSKTILVADDADFMRIMIRDILKEYGKVNFIEARNGFEAVEMYNEYNPDLCILDVSMPQKDGLKTLEEIKQINSEAKTIMFSSLNQQDLIYASFDLGADDFIKKPFKPARLIQSIKDLIGEAD